MVDEANERGLAPSIVARMAFAAGLADIRKKRHAVKWQTNYAKRKAKRRDGMTLEEIRKKLDGVISEVELLRSTWVKGNESRLGWVDRTVESLTTHREWFDHL